MAEAEAAKHGRTMNRDNWRLVVNMHCAEDDETALREVRVGERIETQTYFSETLGRPPMRSEDPLREGLAAATTLVGSPETIIDGINRMLAYTDGGAGAVPVPQPRMGQPRTNVTQLRAVRPLGHAAVPGKC